MSRALLVSTSTTVGGAEKTLFTLATLLPGAGFEVAGVVSVKPEGGYAARLRAAGIHVESLGAARPRASDARRLAEVIRRERPDVVHALMFSAVQLCRLAKPRAGAPFALVGSPRVSYRTRSAWSLLADRWLKGREDFTISECQASADFLVKRQGYDPARVGVVLNGVEVAGWPSSKIARATKRLELRLAAGDLLVGAVGRLDRQKGLDVLIEAMSRLGGLPVRCVILGAGPERAALEEAVRRRHLERSVWLLGERDDVADWLSALDAYALPSRWEGLPNALLEALSLGLPCVASRVDGVPEAVADGATGLLVPPEDPGALAAALRRLAEDRGLRERLGRAAHEDAARRFTVSRMVAEHAAFYRKALELRAR